MIKFACICPHPPIIVPGIGSPKDLKLVKKTIDAMNKMANELSKKDIDTLVVVSPHGMIYPDRMNISFGGEFQGDFKEFGQDQIRFDFLSDDELAEEIIKECEDNGIVTNSYTENDVLDHGVMVPLYYLREALRDDVKIIPINYSMQSSDTHYSFGEIISNVAGSHNFKDKRIGIIASGDMSHRLFQGTSAGFSEIGKEFDQKMIDDIKANNISDILEYDPDWLEAAGECGYRSIVILLGAISKTKYKPEVLSYEGPFGVGYMVANFKID